MEREAHVHSEWLIWEGGFNSVFNVLPVLRIKENAENKEAFLIHIGGTSNEGRMGGRKGENRKDCLDEDSAAQRRLFCYPAEHTISASLFLIGSADPLFSPTSRARKEHQGKRDEETYG